MSIENHQINKKGAFATAALEVAVTFAINQLIYQLNHDGGQRKTFGQYDIDDATGSFTSNYRRCFNSCCTG